MNESRILIIGSNGQLGKALCAKYPNARTADLGELDISNHSSVQNYSWANTDVIINAAAYTNVDGAETDTGRLIAWQVNAMAVSYLSEVATQHKLTLVHISTDYVFDGSKTLHTEDEPLSPLSVYGQSKAAGDIAAILTPKHYILRTSWVIGEGNNFVRTMLGVGKKGIEPTVVADQIGRPTFTNELVRALDYLLNTNSEFGTYNVSNDGDPVSWANLTRKIFELSGYKLRVTNTTTEEYFKGKTGIAPRPLNSTFDLKKLQSTGFKPTNWISDLKEYINLEQKK